MTSDPSKGAGDGPSNDIDPADSHSGEGLASVRPRLARTLADSALRSANRQPDAMTTRMPIDAPPEPETPPAPNSEPQ